MSKRKNMSKRKKQQTRVVTLDGDSDNVVTGLEPGAEHPSEGQRQPFTPNTPGGENSSTFKIWHDLKPNDFSNEFATVTFFTRESIDLKALTQTLTQQVGNDAKSRKTQWKQTETSFKFRFTPKETENPVNLTISRRQNSPHRVKATAGDLKAFDAIINTVWQLGITKVDLTKVNDIDADYIASEVRRLALENNKDIMIVRNGKILPMIDENITFEMKPQKETKKTTNVEENEQEEREEEQEEERLAENRRPRKKKKSSKKKSENNENKHAEQNIDIDDLFGDEQQGSNGLFSKPRQARILPRVSMSSGGNLTRNNVSPNDGDQLSNGKNARLFDDADNDDKLFDDNSSGGPKPGSSS